MWWTVRVSTQAMCLYVQPTQARSPICRRSPINVYNGERNKNDSSQFSMAAISRLTSAFLLWVLWLSGKTIRVVIRRSPVRLPAASLWTFFSLQSLHHNIMHWKASKTCKMWVQHKDTGKITKYSRTGKTNQRIVRLLGGILTVVASFCNKKKHIIIVASFPGSPFALHFVGVRGEPKSEANIPLPLHNSDATSQL